MTPDRRAAWSRARRILCVRTDNMGDLLMTTPALRALRSLAPQLHLALLTSGAAAPAAGFIPEIDELIVHDAPWARHDHDAGAAGDLALIERLREGGFDAAVIFTVYSQNPLPAALICRLAGIPLRLAHCRENPYRLLSDWVRETEPEQQLRHEVQRQLDLVAQVGARADDTRLSFAVREDDRAAVRAQLQRLGIAPGRWVLVHPGASAASRRYPPELFAAALRELHARSGHPIVLGGSAGEREIVEQVRALCDAPLRSLAGALTLGQCAASIEQAALLISNNSGPVHLAAALGTPVVDLYALTNPQHTPWRVRSRVLFHDVPCRNCYRSVCPEQHHACLRGVAPQRLVESALELLDAARAEPVTRILQPPARLPIPAGAV